MSETSRSKGGQRRKQERETIIKELNDSLQTIRSDLEVHTKRQGMPQPGWTFLSAAPCRTPDQEDLAHFAVMRHESDELWLCCKMSIETDYAGPLDLVLDYEDWSGGYPVLMESWNTVVLREEDMGGEFFDEIPLEWIYRALKLFEIYGQGRLVPQELARFCGSPLTDIDLRRPFQQKEADTVERARLHHREDWEKVLLGGAVLAAETADTGLSGPRRKVLLEKEKGGPAITIEQERDGVFLRVYPGGEEAGLEEIVIQGEKITWQDHGYRIEVQLGRTETMPQALQIEIALRGEKHFFMPWFYRSETE